MTPSSTVPSKLGLLCMGVVGLAVLGPSNQNVLGVETTVIKASTRLVSVENFGGDMCPLPTEIAATLDDSYTRPEDIPINPVTVALGMNVRSLQPLALAQQRGGGGQGGGRGAAAFTLAPGAPLPGPPGGINAAKHAAVRARQPIRRIFDRYPQYSAVAVDPNSNEVVVQDENLFQIQVFNRTTNPPAS